ncbi:MAG: DUF2298 domain-containing protein [Archaeoglobaceae archaeon]|uniref:DUF2079 domain-containing protein n=1 Tax=Archaeoglobus fulgidus TaxID=2234 RepID=A0A7J3M2M9_ARCFL
MSSLIITLPFLRFLPYPLARFASILTATFVSFAIAYLVNFKTAFFIVFSALVVLAIFAYKRYNTKPDEGEVVFALIFYFFIFLRLLDPNIFDAEKFMDMAFINSILKSPNLPPNDPFFANGKLDCYYYFGHVLGSAIVLLSFSPPEIGYNVAISAIPAFTATILYGIFRENKRIAVLAIFFTIFSGNAYSFFDFISRPFSIDYLYYWNSTRVIEETINEFPYFSFIHADLHAHVFAIPMKIFLISILLEKTKPYLMIPITLFAIFATNSWDFPLMLFFASVFAISQGDKKALYYSLASFLLVLPFYASMDLPKTEILFFFERTDVLQFLSYSATLLVLVYTFLDKKPILYSLPFAIPLAIFSPSVAVIAPLAIASIDLLRRKNPAGSVLLTGALAFITPEFVAIDTRMNTVFKFYLIAWLFITTGAMILTTKREFRKETKAILLILILIGSVYPIVATPIRYHTATLSLDGMEFTKLYGEYEAIQWLKEKNGIVLEEGCTHGVLCGYSYGGRVATFSGNPAVIAWTNHEYQWRRDYASIAERAKDVREFYSANNCETMERICEKYNVTYIFVGYEERKFFEVDDTVMEKCFEKVFENANVKIFRRAQR